jgi:hypothetical protein
MKSHSLLLIASVFGHRLGRGVSRFARRDRLIRSGSSGDRCQWDACTVTTVQLSTDTSRRTAFSGLLVQVYEPGSSGTVSCQGGLRLLLRLGQTVFSSKSCGPPPQATVSEHNLGASLIDAQRSAFAGAQYPAEARPTLGLRCPHQCPPTSQLRCPTKPRV